MDVVDKIFDIINKNKYTNKSVSKATGIPPSNFTEWYKRRSKPSSEAIIKLAKFFGVTTDYLLMDENDILPTDNVDETNLLPVYGKILSGTDMFAEENVVDYEHADARYGKDGHFFLKMFGDSMEPHIYDEDYILVRNQSSVDSGDLAVLVVDNIDGFVKKVDYTAKCMELHGFNPTYPVRRFAGSDTLRVRILGKVLESRRKW